jgi:hypothetical protein
MESSKRVGHTIGFIPSRHLATRGALVHMNSYFINSLGFCVTHEFALYRAIDPPAAFAIHSYPLQRGCQVSSNIKDA